MALFSPFNVLFCFVSYNFRLTEKLQEQYKECPYTFRQYFLNVNSLPFCFIFYLYLSLYPHTYYIFFELFEMQRPFTCISVYFLKIRTFSLLTIV